jgi:hypothetical protein
MGYFESCSPYNCSTAYEFGIRTNFFTSVLPGMLLKTSTNRLSGHSAGDTGQRPGVELRCGSITGLRRFVTLSGTFPGPLGKRECYVALTEPIPSW